MLVCKIFFSSLFAPNNFWQFVNHNNNFATVRISHIHSDAMVVLRGSPDLAVKTVQALLATLFLWIYHADDMDRYRKFERLENVRENLRNVTECLGYRSCTHPCVLLWQALTAAKIWFDQVGIPDHCPELSEYPYLLASPDGIGRISSPSALSVSCLSTTNSSWNSLGA